MADGRDPARAALAIAGVFALVLAAGLLPAFSAAAPGGDLFRDLGSFGVEDAPNVDSPELGDPGVEDPGVRAPDGMLSFLRDLFGAGDGGELTRDPSEADPSSDPSGGDGGDGGGGDGPPLVDWLSDLFDGDGGDGERPTPSEDVPPCPTRSSAGPYTVCFAERLVPGSETVVTVYRDGDPVSGVELLVNGEPAGRTDSRGHVRVTVPYTDRITVSVRQPDLAPPESRDPAASLPGGVPPPRDPRAYALAGPAGPAPNGLDGTPERPRSQSENGSASAPVETAVTVDVRSPDGDFTPGERAAVRATVQRTPVPDAAVYVDGERVGTTDGSGVAVVELPVARSVNVTVVRGAARGSQRVTLARPELRANGPLGLALPGTGATVVVSDGGDPVEGATVEVAGERIGETDRNGTVATTLPLAPVAGLGAAFPSGLTASRTLHLWIVPVVGLLGVVLLSGAAVTLSRRSERSGRDAAAELGATARAIASDLVSALVGLAEAFEETALAIADRLGTALGNLSLPGRDAVRSVLAGRAAAAWSALVALLTWPLRRLRGGDSVDPDAAGAAPGGGPSTTATAPEFDGARGRIVHAWRGLVRRAGVTRPDTTTPGQVAGRALSAGLPREPVARLTDAFRAVEYGGEDPDGHVESAERAAAELDGVAVGEPRVDGGGGSEPAGMDRDEPPVDGATEGGEDA